MAITSSRSSMGFVALMCDLDDVLVWLFDCMAVVVWLSGFIVEVLGCAAGAFAVELPGSAASSGLVMASAKLNPPIHVQRQFMFGLLCLSSNGRLQKSRVDIIDLRDSAGRVARLSALPNPDRQVVRGVLRLAIHPPLRAGWSEICASSAGARKCFREREL